MRVGIVTWYGVTNYGSALQAYALQQLIAEAGHESLILRHRVHERAPGQPRTGGLKRLDPRTWSPRRKRAARGEEEKTLAIAWFREQNLSVSDTYVQDTPVDLALIGSDQIFDVRGFHDFQFGHGVKAPTISAYAPSFGETTWESLQESPDLEAVRSGVQNMRLLSARDENTAEILRRLSGREIPIVLDPTLVYGFESKQDEWRQALPFERYVAVYAWGGDTTGRAFADSVRSFARRHGLMTVSIGDTRPWCDLNFASASPQEFFSLVADASVLVTNMFHGSCFALRAGVPVVPVVMPHNANKVEGLFRQLGLTGHLLGDVSAIAAADVPDIDYSQVAQKLDVERSKSLDFLHSALAVTE